jgi:hypothetical protein
LFRVDFSARRSAILAYHSALFTTRSISLIAYTCIATVTSGMQVGVVGSLLCVQLRNACVTDLLGQTHSLKQEMG